MYEKPEEDIMRQTDNLAVNSIRILSADAIQKANSGHPGLPLGAAPAAFELWAHHMNHNPADPHWENRDRFVLSGGHGSMMLYSLLHLFGYGLTKEDLMNFRQWGAKTPGHPEYGFTTGVEATTGPLGAGMAMAVGMAMAEAHLASVFNKENFPVVDHYTYVLGGDGCMMEGISSEAFSLAGTLGLSKLIVLYDSNRITIEGSTDLAFRENVEQRMQAFGFQTLTVEDGNDLDAIGAAIEEAKRDDKRPSFITIKTQIGYGCPARQGTAKAHGEPLGEENVKELRKTLGWPLEEPFAVPEEVYDYCRGIAAENAETEAAWYSAVTSEKTPTVLVLTRQNLIPVEGTSKDALRGGYILSDCEGTPEAILMASGSEVSLAVEAKKILEAEGKKIRIVSMPCVELFEKQDAAYKEAVLPDAVRKRVAVEALSGMSWYKYVGLDGKTVTLDHFGASAPAGILFEKFGFTAEHVADTVRSLF